MTIRYKKRKIVLNSRLSFIQAIDIYTYFFYIF